MTADQDTDYETGMLREKPYKDGELLRELYVEEEMSTVDIADKLDCAPNTVRKYLKKNGVEIRDRSTAMKLSHGSRPNETPFGTHENGPEVWWLSPKDTGKKHVYVHRLVAVAEYGFDAVAGSHVHHKNEIRWDNRPGNLEPMDPGEHSAHHHRKVDWVDKLGLTEMYLNTENTMKDLAGVFGLNRMTVSAAINEVRPYDER